MDRADWIQMQQDLEAQEYEAVTALETVRNAGLVAEAEILARACGLSARLGTKARDVGHIQFP